MKQEIISILEAKIEYANIIKNAKNRDIIKEYGYEIHHIVPKSLGKLRGWGYDRINNEKNLVKLTYEEHYKAHLLLTVFTKGDEYHACMCAFWNMACLNRKSFISSVDFSILKKEIGKNISVMTKIGMENMSEESRNALLNGSKKGAREFWNNDENKKKQDCRNNKISKTISKKWETGEYNHKVKHVTIHNCHFCEKIIKGPSNIIQHEKRCKNNPNPGEVHDDTKWEYRKTCQFCDKIISGGRYHRERHEKTCLQNPKNKGNKL